jgi:hypothetical protein
VSHGAPRDAISCRWPFDSDNGMRLLRRPERLGRLLRNNHAGLGTDEGVAHVPAAFFG